MRHVAPTTLLFLVGLAGCAHVEYAGPAQYQNSGLVINVEKIEYDDDTLECRFVFLNNTDKTMMVDRNQIVAALPDGTLRAREQGAFGIPTQGVYTLMPHMSHEVYVDYKVPDTTPQVTLQLKGITVDGQLTPFPDYVLARQAR
jgi:hypothetical protein